MNLLWIQKHPDANPEEHLGFLPEFVSTADPRPAKEQFHTAYAHGGGWSTIPGLSLLPNGNLTYPGDPVFEIMFEAKFRDEIIRVYKHGLVAIVQPDGSFEASRMD